MASARKVAEKRHNPVESICRKIIAIQKREEISSPGRQITKYQSSSFNSPQTNTKKDFEEVLKKMTASHSPMPNAPFSSPEKDDAFISSPLTVSPTSPPTSHLSSPENAAGAVILPSSENISRPQSQSYETYTSLVSQIRKGERFSNKDLNNHCSENNFRALALDSDSTSDQSSEFVTQDSVAKKLSLSEDGSVGMAKIIDHLGQTTSQDSEEPWSTLDPETRDLQVDLETSHATRKEWTACCRYKGEVSDLITYVADLHFNKQKLEEENNRLKLALETLEEANSQLSEDCTELRLQIKSAHQAIMRTNLLKEELEELKISMNASEEQKTTILAQNKQLETENRALILEIRILQEENTKNITDIYELEKKIEELSETETERQMQLHTYENTLLNKDASLQKKDLSIEELKSTIVEYRNVIENLRGDKNKLVQELQRLQQELLVKGIQLNVSGERNSIISEGEKSLHCELILAQSAENNETECQGSSISLSSLDTMMDQGMLLLLRDLEQKGVEFTAMLQELHEEVSEVETFIYNHLKRVTNTEITAEEKRKNMLIEFKCIMEEKQTLCIPMLNNLGKHRESLDKQLVKLTEILKRFRLEYFSFRKEFLSRKKQIEAIKKLQEDTVSHEAILRKKAQEASQWLKDTEDQVEDHDQAAHSAREKAESRLHKLEGAILEQRTLRAVNTELVNTCQTLEQKTRKRTNALHLDSLTTIPRLELTPFSRVASGIHASCERPKYGELEGGALGVTGRHKYPGPTAGPHPGADLPGCVRMNDDLRMDENGAEHICSKSLPQPREYSTLASPAHTSSTESTITSSDSGSEILNMASGDLDCKSVCEKEEDTRSASVIKIKDKSPAPESIALQGSVNEDKTMLNLEAKEEPETIDVHRKECATGVDTAVSTLPVTTMKSVNFKQSDNTSATEKEVEAEFLRLSLGFKCDWFTLEKRVKLEERSRDLAEENLKEEITNCLKLLESLAHLCEDDHQAQEIIQKLEKSITFLSQCTTRVASRAEMLGAINQESRVSKAVEVMIQHVENLKRMYTKEHTELEELKEVLLQNERSFNPLEDEEDCQIKKRSASLNSKPPSLRRVTIASLPRNIGNAGMVAGMENNDRFSRRSSSWRILGSKQSEHRPSLHRFISSYSWADAEEEKCELKTKEDSEPPEEEIVERTRKPSLSEKRNNPSKWDVSAVYDTIASWATNLKTSIGKANRALWLSIAFVVLFAALVSFLTGRFFQKSVDAAPTQEGDSWRSLEHILWPFTRLRHNGPPPV
ncbi:Inositol 1,4,5-Triphosphate Receptor Associated 2 [Manis pentadactyla]|nr:Inositol 1,4,5-Triphosphate Receptor Associated 2 [Manis pentadactyla]